MRSLVLPAIIVATAQIASQGGRPRARDLGIAPGALEPGPLNAIADVAGVRVGQVVHADFEAMPGDHRMGRISYVYPTLDVETRTVRVRVALRNPDLRLKPGMYATIRIAGSERASVLTVPRSAVLSTGERSIVFVRDANGSLSPREVSVGASNDERIEILRGVAAGERVVSSATFLVDAESNLGTALGGMGDMPGMDMTTPPKPVPTAKE